jgi:signal transduction histidine kinase
MHRTRDPLLLIAAALLLGVTVLGGIEAVSWIGRPFPGFLLLGNRVVASAGLRDWRATGGGEIYQPEVVAVDGVPLDEARSLRELVSSLPAGTELRYRFRRGEREVERSISTRVFSGSDFLLLFGSYLLCGLGLGGTALAIRYLLGLGRRLSGRFYCGDDRRLLHTLANQGGVAIDNALALEQLREFNRDLEKKVGERSSELAEALEELRETQAQLVHQEKMASVGQLVAGIAHEINNAINFIQGNIHYLRKYTEALTGSLEDYERVVTERSPDSAAELEKVRSAHRLAYVLEDLESAFAGCEEGVERTTTLVKNLRTFSRLDLAELSRVNVHEALESALSLLKGRLSRIRVVKDYGEIPPVECLGSQLNQVFMNLLSNAVDAVGESGTITIRTRPQGEGRVAIEIEDDGCGIEPEHLGRIFEPFFTTKAVGQGTGLGLAIIYGVLTRHRAEIRVRSEVGRGACFEVELPVEFSPPDDAGNVASGP